MAEITETEPKRTDNDLDSITVGTPTRGQIKLYFDSKKDTADDMEQRIDWITSCVEYARTKLEK